MRTRTIKILIATLSLALLSACDGGSVGSPDRPTLPAPEVEPKGDWFAVWATAHQGSTNVSDQTFRTIVRASVGGTQAQVKFRNKRGDAADITIDAATISIRDGGPDGNNGGADIKAETLTTLTFNGGQTSVTVPAGEDVFSDQVEFPVAALEDVAITFYISGAGTTSQDANGFVTSYRAAGDQLADTDGSAFSGSGGAQVVMVEELALFTDEAIGSAIAIGGSVVDGTGSARDGYDRWTAWLARRFQEELPAGMRIAIGNEGIGGNTTQDVIDRYDRDLLDKTGVTHAIIYAGTNDLTTSDVGEGAEIIDRYREIIALSHAQNIKVIIATITPRGSYTAAGNYERKLVNDWLRRGQNCSGECDGIVDFDAAVESYANPNQIEPGWDTDSIHPNGIGYGAMAQMFNLQTFMPQCPQECSLPLHPEGPGAPKVYPAGVAHPNDL